MPTFSRPQTVMEPTPAQYSHILFRNPAGSGVLITMRKIIVFANATFHLGFRDGGNLYDNPPADPNNMVQGLEIGSPRGLHLNRALLQRPDGLFDVPREIDGSEVLSKGETYGSGLETRIAMGQFAQGFVSLTFDEPITLQPDRAVMVRTERPGVPLVVSWVWDEIEP